MKESLSPNDSRSFTSRIIFGDKWPLSRKLLLFLLVILVSSVITWYAYLKGIETPALNALFLLLLAAGLWITEAIRPFAVSILIIGYSIYFLYSFSPFQITPDWEQYTGTFSNPVIWILIGGFILALGARITGFDKSFSKFVIARFGTNPKYILLGVMLTTALLSMFMSNTATSAMMLAVAMPILSPLEKSEPFRKALILGIAAAAALGGMGTLIGSPPNAIAAGIIQSKDIDFGFIEWMFAGIPLAFFFVIAAWFLLKIKYKTNIKELKLYDDSEIKNDDESDLRNTLKNRVIVVITFCVTLFLWMTSGLHGIPVAAVSFIPIVSFAVSGLVRSDDIKLLPWDTLLLVAGGLTLGIAITETGLAKIILDQIPSGYHNLVILFILAYLSALLSNIMSNTAAASILIPVGTSFLPGTGIIVPIIISLCASTALLLPISTPPNALAYSTGILQQADFRYIGIIAAFFAPLVIIVVVTLIY
jgi:solute carrier family 13 (sodium-dependent dicarboxylate transporter), member 2/3/5